VYDRATMATKGKAKASKKPLKKQVTTVRNTKDILHHGSNLKSRFIPTLSELKQVVDQLKGMGFRIVLTQGVYDLIHEGHAEYLEKAKSYGDILIVGLDSDELTKRRKGPGRPIVPQSERAKMLAHLRAVDIIALKDVDQELNDLIDLVEPDVMVFSESTKDIDSKIVNQYKKARREVVVLPPQSITSTSARIRNLTIEGAEELGKEVKQLVENFLLKVRQGK
jgi:D-glycero-beta-D-manno-heptose 1-phosphate adenylyltransferase